VSEHAGEVRVDGSPTRCPYCKDQLADVKAIVACAACGARHHAACHAENRRCATCGATDVLVPSGAGAPAPTASVAWPAQPASSSVLVLHDDNGVVFTWACPEPFDALSLLGGAICLTVVGLPLGLWLLSGKEERLARREKRFVHLRLGRDTLEYRSDDGMPSFSAPRRRLGAHVAESDSGYHLAIHEETPFGTRVQHDVSTQQLRREEIDWLAETILAWKLQP